MERLAKRLLKNEPLARFTAARLGGTADWLYIARTSAEELVDVVAEAWSLGLPVRVLGGGANVLVSDKGVRGLVVINHIADILTGKWHDGRNLSATSGVSLTALSRKCQSLGFSGMEWAVGVPGTVGGAIVNNAGAHGSDIGSVLADVVVFERQKGPQLYTRDELNYAYRSSDLKTRADKNFLVLLATFCLAQDDSAAIQNRMDDFTAYRKRTQPPGASLGSIFKNPPGDFAGRLIESAGLKGYRIGNAEVSTLHANWFINSGGQATAADYYALVKHVREVVYHKFSIELETEIELLGEW